MESRDYTSTPCGRLARVSETPAPVILTLSGDYILMHGVILLESNQYAGSASAHRNENTKRTGSRREGEVTFTRLSA